MTTFKSFKAFWRSMSVQGRIEVAQRVGYSMSYLEKVATGERRPGAKLTVKIEQVCGYPKEKLRPDIWDWEA